MMVVVTQWDVTILVKDHRSREQGLKRAIRSVYDQIQRWEKVQLLKDWKIFTTANMGDINEAPTINIIILMAGVP